MTGSGEYVAGNMTMQNFTGQPYGNSSSALQDNLESSLCNTASAHRITTADNMRLLNKSQTSPKMDHELDLRPQNVMANYSGQQIVANQIDNSHHYQ